jgi:putative ABC transport system permease protein
MIALIAWRTLTHDRTRLAVTLIGIVFSVVLVGMQVGLLLNFVNTTSIIPTSSQADIFVTAPGVSSAEISTPQNERRRYQVLGVPGVAVAESYIVDFTFWKRPNGVRESVILIGVAPDATMGLPWLLEGDVDGRRLLEFPDGVIVDRLYFEKLGVTAIGEMFEINGVRARVVGFTKGVRTFVQSPYIFTSLANARRIMGMGDKHISYVLVKAEPGVAIAKLVADIQAHIPDSTVRTTRDFAHGSSYYWLFTTGAGASLIISAVLGILVGCVVVTQTLYANTIDRLPEYATLRAIGGGPGYLYSIVIGQAALAALIGYLIGLAIVLVLVYLGRDASAAPVMPPWLMGVLAVNTFAVCLIAATVSLGRLNRIDPAQVFK